MSEKEKRRDCIVNGQRMQASQFWLDMPYCLRIYEDGMVVLFNRHYQALVEKPVGEPAHPAPFDTFASDEWKGEPITVYFYDDECSPSFNEDTRRILDKALVAFGLPRQVTS